MAEILTLEEVERLEAEVRRLKRALADVTANTSEALRAERDEAVALLRQAHAETKAGLILSGPTRADITAFLAKREGSGNG